jgi:hypothetical protein
VPYTCYYINIYITYVDSLGNEDGKICDVQVPSITAVWFLTQYTV